MKILIVTGIYPPDIGGPASYVPRIAHVLATRGHSIEVVTLADEPAPGAADSYPVHRIPRSLAKPLRMAKTVAAIALRARKSDVVFANGLFIEAVLAATIARCPVVAKVVGDTIWERARNAGRDEALDEFQRARLPLKWRLLRSLQDSYMCAVERVITPSLYLKRIVVGWGVAEDRVSVVYNAVPMSRMSGIQAPEFDLAGVGRLVPWKGFAELIALAGARGWSLRVVGDGPLRRTLEAQAASAGARIRFDGDLPQSEVAAAIRSARVFVLNSSYEGLPHIVLEAMAAGVPVVATAAGGTPETIDHGESGLLVPVGDTAALEQAIATLLGDAARRRRIAQRASAKVAVTFSLEAMATQTEAVLEAVATRRKRA